MTLWSTRNTYAAKAQGNQEEKPSQSGPLILVKVKPFFQPFFFFVLAFGPTTSPKEDETFRHTFALPEQSKM